MHKRMRFGKLIVVRGVRGKIIILEVRRRNFNTLLKPFVFTITKNNDNHNSQT